MRVSKQENHILSLVEENDGIDRKTIMQISGLSSTRSYEVLTMLVESGMIKKKKRGKTFIYFSIK